MAAKLHFHIDRARKTWLAEDGSTSIWSMFWTVIFILIGGLAIDASNAHRYRLWLQATADASAHAAIMAYYEADVLQEMTGAVSGDPAARARAAAAEMASRNMYAAQDANVLTDADVKFGSWNAITGVFDTSGPVDAVQVTTRRSDVNGNALPTYFLKIFGSLASWDLAGRAVAQTYSPPCSTDGIIAAGIVDMQSNNEILNGFCIYGDAGVEFNQNNDFQSGVKVIVTDLGKLTVPGFDGATMASLEAASGNNDGLPEAVGFGVLSPHLAANADAIIASLTDIDSKWQPDWIRDNAAAQVINVNRTNFDPDALAAGNVYNVSCNGGKSTLSLRGKGETVVASNGKKDKTVSGGATVIENVVIVTDCDVVFDQDTEVRNAIVATTSTDSKSMKGSASVSIGAPDDCTEGGGAVLMTLGGMHFAAKMEFHGSQLVSVGDIHLSAQVDGVAGTSIQSMGNVDLASNNVLGLCKGTSDPVIASRFYRMVQ